MIDLKEKISAFSNEEKQQFLIYLEKKNKRTDAKNIALFKLLDSSTHYSSTEICQKLYHKNNKAAYHALRKRLYDALIDFMANTSIEDENSIDIQVIKQVIAARAFLLRNQIKTAYKILDKAESIAIDYQLFPILNEIYHTKIQYAYAHNSDLNLLIQKLENSQKQYYLEQQLNIVYAKVRQTINTILYDGNTIDFSKTVETTLKEHNISINESLSFKALYQLMQIVSISAFATNNYLGIELFLLETYAKVKTLKFNVKQNFYHIEVLYIIANTLFRNKKFEASLYYLDLMMEEMKANKKKHYKSFLPKYHLLLAMNYNYSNEQEKAIGTLLPYLKVKHSDIDTLLKIHLGLVVYFFQKGDFKNAKSVFSKFYHTDNWYIKKAGKEWVIKKNLIEILLHIELQNIDLVESRILSFKRGYYGYLNAINEKRVITYLGFIETYYKHPEKVITSKFHNKIENAFVWVSSKEEDIFVMSFYAWLKSKMEQQPLYETTLKLIEQARVI